MHLLWEFSLGTARALKHNQPMSRTAKVAGITPGKPKNPAAVALGRLGGLKGGKARAEALTPEARKEIARRAAKQRWANRERKVAEV